MKIVFMHYHLKPGGVTTVIRQQAAALADDTDILILTGDAADLNLPFKTVTIEGLKYDQEKKNHLPPQEIAEQISAAIHNKWPEGCDLIHVHNPTLAKNRSFLSILKELIRQGQRLLLQIHDFAEDGRPQAYFTEAYPADCHYAVINRNDYQVLMNAGLTKAGLHQLPNSVNPIDTPSSSNEVRGSVLYPIRAIRRKNVGEAILLSLFFPAQQKLVITLPPNSPVDIVPYEDWKQYVAEHQLNVIFEAGLCSDFNQLLANASWVLTTSIMEGFGFSFLEPWSAGKALWGRRLPHVCGDFEEKGISFGHLYDKLNIPISWIGKDKLYIKWKQAVSQVCEHFDTSVDDHRVTRSFTRMTAGGMIDFGMLAEGFQKTVIQQLLLDPVHRSDLVKMNPFLRCPGPSPENSHELIRANTRLINQHFNRTEYGERLKEIYQQVIEVPVSQKIDKKSVISSFLNLEEFSLLKWGSYAD